MTSSNEFIVAGVDGSVAGDDAARWAAEEAARRHCELRLVHAYELPPNAGYPEWNAYPDDLRPVLRDMGQQMVDRLAAELQTTYPELAISSRVRYERSIVVLREESDHALLSVVGSGDTSRIYGVLLGSVALAIASTNPAPVAVIHHGQTPRTTGPVVVGVDGSHTSDAAISFAFQAASVRGTNLVAAHVWADTIAPGTRTLENVLIDPARIEQEEQALLAERIAGWSDKYPDVSVQQTILKGRAVTELLDQTKQAQLLVVGSHGRGGFAGMLLSSTSHSLILHSDCPVVVVRPGSEE
jgi:nucleotide-binding universal stress UspA family protein